MKSAAKENSPAMRAWLGHEWNCSRCSLGYSKGFCEEGENLRAELKASEDRLSLVHSKRISDGREPEREFRARPFDPTRFILPETPGQKELLVSMLTGSQAKTAFALRMNCEKMIKEGGLNCTGFLTLTVGDYVCPFHGIAVPREHGKCPHCSHEMSFVQVYDVKEASRRINNLNRRILPILFERAICVTERMKSGAIHFHLIGILCGRPDIRTGLDFDALKERDYSTASPELRRLWGRLRAILPRYGFGRAELLQIKKTGEAVSSYISKYIEKNVANRTKEDAHKKLVRYIGWGKQQLKPNEFEWNGEKSKAWRAKSREILATVLCELPDRVFEPEKRIKEFCCLAAGKIRPKMLDGSEAKEAFGSRWAWHVNRIRACFDTTQQTEFLIWGFEERQLVRNELFKLAPGWCRNRESQRLLFSDEVREIRLLPGYSQIQLTANDSFAKN